MTAGPIGIFDSGYGGLTVFRAIRQALPEYDYIYLGDNARTPYGTRSQDMVHRFTLESVKFLFDQGCHLIILACNSASASALRRIQQVDMLEMPEHRRVLGVVRPTAERMAVMSASGHIGICATEATIRSGAYIREAAEYAPGVMVYQQACPLWVPLVEAGDTRSAAAIDISRRYLDELLSRSIEIDAVLLGCTHYPLLRGIIEDLLPQGVRLYDQGAFVAESLVDYMQRHPEMVSLCSRGGEVRFTTTDDHRLFDRKAAEFWGTDIHSSRVIIPSL